MDNTGKSGKINALEPTKKSCSATLSDDSDGGISDKKKINQSDLESWLSSDSF